ncbi:MAG: HAMP domain-containing protein [Planctomycetes bacterium]|nr:HAMP domain-containing protein [Planctomycetota bacterium]
MSFPKFLELPDIGALLKIDDILARKRVSRFQLKLMIYFTLMSCLVSIIVVFMIYRASTNTLLTELKTQLRRLAESVSMDFNGNAHKELVASWEKYHIMAKSNADEHIIGELRDKIVIINEIQQTKLKKYYDLYNFSGSSKILYIYTMFMKPANTSIFNGISADEPDIFADNSSFNSVYSTENIDGSEILSLKRAFLGKPGTDDNLVTDEKETTLSGYSPIYDSQNNVVAIIGIDFDASEVREIYSDIIFWTVFALIISGVLSLTLTFYLSGQITRPIKELIKATKEIGEGNFDYRLNIKNRDEIGDLASSINYMSKGLKERDWIKNTLKRYVSEQVAKKIMENPEQLKLQAERNWATLLFTDIEGFTTVAEKSEPEHVFAMLNEYLSSMIEIIFKYEGTLDKFMGDGVMAIFGAPYKIEFSSEKAIKCALEMQKKVSKMRDDWSNRGWFPIKIRIGINTGFVVSGNIGSEKRSEFTVIGDTVNLASRLEQKNKELETWTLISASTYIDVEIERKKYFANKQHDDDDNIISREIKPEIVCGFEIVSEYYINVKGKEEQIRVFAIKGNET